MPDRGDEEYDMFAKYVNCFEHACFNLSNRELEELGIDCFEYTYRSPFGEFSQNSIHEAKEEMLEFLTQTGLLVEKFDGKKILKSNQHKVALYFSEAFEREQGERDYHFLLQRKDGKWSGKCGDMSSRVESYETLEETLPYAFNNKYKLDTVLVLTNPYASEERQK